MSDFIKIEEGIYNARRVEFTIQDGPIKAIGVNGCQIDDVIEFARDFIAQANDKLPCRENSLALTKLDEALHWLKARRENREKRGVEGLTKV